MKYLLTLFAALTFHGLFAQFGVYGYYQNQYAPDWEAAFGEQFQGKETVDFLTTGYRFGADYWIKPLEDLRITATPGLSYARSSSTSIQNPASPQIATTEFGHRNIGIIVPVNIYFFDLYGDCDCPTWSQSEPFLKKGFFFQVMPAAYVNSYRADNQEFATIHKSTDFNFALGVGAGLDIGFSDLITLSPTVRYVHNFGRYWQDLPFLTVGSIPDHDIRFKSDVRVWEFGMRLGVRLDY